MTELLEKLVGDPLVANAIIAVVALAVFDWLTGTIRAIADKTFDLAYIDVWVRVQLLGRVLPIVLTLAFAGVIGDITFGDITLNVLTAAGLAAAATYAASAIKSIIDNLNRSATNTIPKE